jgi:cytochrome b subunit of formate dehydrogenase
MATHAPHGRKVRHIRRFDAFDRGLHLALMTSFLGLAATGLPLLFIEAPWAPRLSRLFGGVAAAGTLHRVFAVVLIGTFLAHLARLFQRIVLRKEPLLWGPASMVPQPRDLREFAAHMKWFVGRGPRPAFDHFTYWEKFDYWAVFWGMAIIGGSGLMLWFPEAFARIVPGQAFNIALVVHGEEALLAVAFIFTIHFFNGHFRPEKFPIDTVIFTGSVPETELQEERPGEYERLARDGRLDQMDVPPPPRGLVLYGRIVGGIALGTGVFLFLLILRAVLF